LNNTSGDGDGVNDTFAVISVYPVGNVKRITWLRWVPTERFTFPTGYTDITAKVSLTPSPSPLVLFKQDYMSISSMFTLQEYCRDSASSSQHNVERNEWFYHGTDA